MKTYTKIEAMKMAKADLSNRIYGRRYVYDVWGGTTGYTVDKDGIHITSRNDSGGVKGILAPNRLVVKA